MNTENNIKKLLKTKYNVSPKFDDQIESAILEADEDGKTTFIAGRKEFCLISLGVDGYALAEVKSVDIVG